MCNTNNNVSTGKIVLCTFVAFLGLLVLPFIIKTYPILFFCGLGVLFVGCALFTLIAASYSEHKKSKKLRAEFLAQFEDPKES